MYDLTEMKKLEQYLEQNGIRHECGHHAGGVYINVYEHADDKKRAWDAIINDLSYGRDDGLLEIMGTIVDEESAGDKVEGWLTADDVIKRYERYYNVHRDNEEME